MFCRVESLKLQKTPRCGSGMYVALMIAMLERELSKVVDLRPSARFPLVFALLYIVFIYLLHIKAEFG